MKKIEVRYTPGEEIFNSISHISALIMSIVFMILLIIKFQNDKNMLIASIVYTTCLILMYLFSTLYHAIRPGRAKNILRLFDHSAIFICIAGTYTPVISCCLKGFLRIFFLILIWTLCLGGITLKIFAFCRDKVSEVEKLSLFLYIFIGWISIFMIHKLVTGMSFTSFLLILIGGLIYTWGIYFYKKRKLYFHGIWHIFIIFASILQFSAIYII